MHTQAFSWYIVSLLISFSNDLLTKYVVLAGIAPEQITFYRSAIGLVLVAIYMLIRERKAFFTTHLRVHIFRGSIFFIASYLWSYGLQQASLTSAVIIGFTIPLHTLVLAGFLLKEKIGRPLGLAACIGFLGALIMVCDPSDFAFSKEGSSIHTHFIALCLSSFLFALLNVINKKYVAKEPMLSMLFYSHLIATLCGLSIVSFELPSMHMLEKGSILLLGFGGVGVLFCLLKAYAYAPVSLLAPLGYVEVLIACVFDYLFFSEMPTLTHLIGASLIIPASFFVFKHPHQA